MILRECWCEDAIHGGHAPGVWRALARIDKAMTDRALRPLHIIAAEKRGDADRLFFEVAIACEPGRAGKPFWKWWTEREPDFAASRAGLAWHDGAGI